MIGGAPSGGFVPPRRLVSRGFAKLRLGPWIIAGSSLLALPGLRAQNPLPGTAALTAQGDLSAQMVAGIGRFLDQNTAHSEETRKAFWKIDLTGDRAAYEKSVEPNRERLRRIIGAIDPRLPDPELEYLATFSTPAKVAETDLFTAYAVRWPVFEGVYGEGLLLQPKGRIVARVVAVPDADQVPEIIAGLAPGLPSDSQFARRLAENGCQVIVPTLADRSDTFSGNPTLERQTNLPHREWIYRQAFVLGRHVIGYEVQKILAAIDWLTRQNRGVPTGIGVVGWGEGGLLAFYSAAVDTRIDAVLVSGYFGQREQLWREPIYRNVFGLLREFGDAEIARLIVPRALLVEHAPSPAIEGPPTARPGRAGGAPGRLATLDVNTVRAEISRAQQLAGPWGSSIHLFQGSQNTVIGPVAEGTLLSFRQGLSRDVTALKPPGPAPTELRPGVDFIGRQQRQVREMERHTQGLLRLASRTRDEFLWKKVTPTTPEAWREAMRPYREKVWNELIGRFPTGEIPLNPRSRLIYDQPTWTGHEVMLDVLPDVYAWGYFLVPKGLKPGEKRPVVVAQHGVRALPADVMNEDPDARAYGTYKAFAVRLVERGFIVFAPHNPYCGDDPSRTLQRKANPLGKTIFSIIIAQHERILDWLSSQPSVDANRIGYYGLSYGGQTAMRVPVVLERYAVSICSGDFNEWTFKNVSTDLPFGYMFAAAYERPDFNMGMTYGYAELAALMVPRPFMVERGHNDGVAIDEWVAFEYAKVNRLYNQLHIPHRTEIEYFDGPHTIHGIGTYKFLHRHLNWPEPGVASPEAGVLKAGFENKAK